MIDSCVYDNLICNSHQQNKQYGKIWQAERCVHNHHPLPICIYHKFHKYTRTYRFLKCSDIIHHNIVFFYLLSMGVSPPVYSGWLTSFMGSSKRSNTYILFVIPQGTNLAPIIFLSIINRAQEDRELQTFMSRNMMTT